MWAYIGPKIAPQIWSTRASGTEFIRYASWVYDTYAVIADENQVKSKPH